MKALLCDWYMQFAKYIDASPSLWYLWSNLRLDGGTKAIMLQISRNMPDPEKSDVSMWIKGGKITPDLMCIIAHEMKHADIATNFRDIDDVDNERIAFAFQNLVRAELKANGFKVTKKSLPMDEADIVRTYRAYYKQYDG